MGLFDFFYKKTITVEDEFFGKLFYINIDNAPDQSYFEGQKQFKPSGVLIDCLINAPKEGPSKKHCDFYSDFENSYDLLVRQITHAMNESLQGWNKEKTIISFIDEFTLVGLTIPWNGDQYLDWNISFETIHDENHMFTVYFEDMQPAHITIDG